MTASVSVADPVPLACRQFHRSWSERCVFGAEAEGMHEALLRATFGVEPGVPRRRSSISVDGTPIVHSLKMTPGDGPPAYRFLCEPGGLSRSVREQIRYSLATVETIAGQLGWTAATAAFASIVERAVPPVPQELSDWHGGIWLGAALSPGRTELRAYVNLRHGEILARWQRVADLMAPFATPRTTSAVRRWMQDAGRVAIPVGVGVVMTASGLRALRFYLGVEYPGIDTIRLALGDAFNGPHEALGRFCDAFVERYGMFQRQSVTLAYDFVVCPDGWLEADISRAKVDVSFGHIKADCEPHLFIADQVEQVVAGASVRWHAFRDQMNDVYGGSGVEYLSLAAHAGGLDEATVYVRPRLASDA